MLSTPVITHQSAPWRAYLELCKPRVVLLIMITAIVGMCLASPGAIPLRVFFIGNIGIALSAFGAACINHIADQAIDRKMQRTLNRPIATARISTTRAVIFAFSLCALSMFLLVTYINVLTAALTFCTIIAYAFVYTFYLKHATPQNIVIGGIAGAAPPMLGWVAVTGHVDGQALLLLLIIFVWTPPHFWALAINRIDDYANAKVPMLPNTHGIQYTKVNIVAYTCVLSAVTLIPFLIHMSGWPYLIAALCLNIRFLQWSWRLYKDPDNACAMAVFRYSILYLGLLFSALLIDHYVSLFIFA